MRHRIEIASFVALIAAGCGGRTAPANLITPAYPAADAAAQAGDLFDHPVDHVPQPPRVPEFCRGTPVLRVNDLPLTIITAQGGPSQMSCCDGATLYLSAWSPEGQRVDVDVLVGAPPGAAITWPLSLDLAHARDGWAFRFRAMYRDVVPDPCPYPCVLSNVGEPIHDGEFVGYVKLLLAESGERRISVCAEARPGDSATTNLWSLRIYAPDVALSE